jgi:hypothetical protein
LSAVGAEAELLIQLLLQEFDQQPDPLGGEMPRKANRVVSRRFGSAILKNGDELAADQRFRDEDLCNNGRS